MARIYGEETGDTALEVTSCACFFFFGTEIMLWSSEEEN
jgi:hypothetical protein